ncbi:type I-B CRISPR-associated protein Cas5b [Campylobacter hominis]|uniref:Crispr-associated protein Cas5, hmari subtype n=1 Tax=Campylobacter hominis (strain ATCC BAA-381 / DSM 21671 / CCUG 45161 / LMG 19568 / NCTC 13146 / CH001A) TaxID=360107 RepID=A7I0F5_CAMHC|nr:type I-B CRISPR-associated protein Cas5b [Campylobacter hominis]ABS51485.1 crispr-associated protein Cas5, hmari subtype [Campylobacter hominis ATCC BAA-381]UAK85168.1 type I-B CRISPR-associated protein Cas5b [Campylobacter hominis]SUW84544.1 CRISPR-associated protein Cas5, hmari subtype [Campylobacter hominis]
MKALSFKLSGKFAFFKKPDVNEHVYFSYNNIPKPTLLGLLGAIIGLGGYAKECELGNRNNPEFYEKLKYLKIALIPLAKFGRFNKKIQTFNNGVGANQDGNLIIKEQWLENPAWQILIKDDKSDEFSKISKFLMEKKAIFIPYLGKNDHFASISEVKIVNLDEFKEKKGEIISLVLEKNVKNPGRNPSKDSFIFSEYYPIGFDENGFYTLEKTIFTNQTYEIGDGFYKYKESAICFL